MAKKTNFSGRIGNVIFYTSNGQQLARSKPGKIKQTTSTKNCSAIFGEANRIGKALRESLDRLLPLHPSKAFRFGLHSAIYRWLLTNPINEQHTEQLVEPLTNFQLTDKIKFAERVRKPMMVIWSLSGPTVISIPNISPVQDLRGPADTIKTEIEILGLTCDLNSRCVIAEGKVVVGFDHIVPVFPAQSFEISITLQPGCLSLIAATARFYVNRTKEVSVDKRPVWQPGAILQTVFI